MHNDDPVTMRAIDAYMAIQTETGQLITERQRQASQLLQFIQERGKTAAPTEPTLRQRIWDVWGGYPEGMRLITKQIAKHLSMKVESRPLTDELAAMRNDGWLGNEHPQVPGFFKKCTLIVCPAGPFLAPPESASQDFPK